jgi:hypothetical protein
MHVSFSLTAALLDYRSHSPCSNAQRQARRAAAQRAARRPVRAFRYLTTGPLRQQMLSFYAVSTAFTRRLTDVRANSKFWSPEGTPEDISLVRACSSISFYIESQVGGPLFGLGQSGNGVPENLTVARACGPGCI